MTKMRVLIVFLLSLALQADAQSTATTNAPTLSTTEEPSNMCTVLQQIASRAPDDFVCSTNQQCDGVDCTADLSGSHYRSQAVILVCQLPHPAVNVVLMTQSGIVLVNETVDHSDVVSFHQLLQLNITLDQLQNAIGFQVEATFLTNPPIPILEYTVIPVDTAKCHHPTPRIDTTTPTTPTIPTASTDGTAGTEKEISATNPEDVSAGNHLVPGVVVLLLALLGGRYCTH